MLTVRQFNLWMLLALVVVLAVWLDLLRLLVKPEYPNHAAPVLSFVILSAELIIFATIPAMRSATPREARGFTVFLLVFAVCVEVTRLLGLAV